MAYRYIVCTSNLDLVSFHLVSALYSTLKFNFHLHVYKTTAWVGFEPCRPVHVYIHDCEIWSRGNGYISQGTVVPLYKDCIGCFPILPYLRKFQFLLKFNSTSTNIKVKITMKINPYQKFDVI